MLYGSRFLLEQLARFVIAFKYNVCGPILNQNLLIICLCFLQDLNLSTERLNSNKAFTNKLWNAGKFVLQNLPSQSDVSAWEKLTAYKVCSSSSHL